jgi:hypothetical protein
MRWSPIGHRSLRSGRTRHGLLAVLALYAAGIVAPAMLAARLVAAAPAPDPDTYGHVLAARVLWLSGDRLYLASVDSVALENGMRLTFTKRGKPVASAWIERVVDGHMIAARLLETNASALRKPEQLEVRVSPASPAAPATLRVGIPGRERPHPLASCAGDSLALPAAISGWRVDAPGAREVRYVRPPGPADDAQAVRWPDTVRVVRFAESTDEEIALERGELDVGVFWPGELSAAMRQGPLGAPLLSGARAHEALVIAFEPPDSAAHAAGGSPLPVAALDQLNRERFRGDLEPLVPDPGAAATPAPVRFVVDASIAPHTEIERALNAGAAAAGAGREPTVRVSLADPAQARGAMPVLRVRCPVVCAPALRPYVRALGADRFAELPACARVGAP